MDKFTKGELKAIKLAGYFTPEIMKRETYEVQESSIAANGLSELREDPDGKDYRRAFIDMTNHGKRTKIVNNIKEYLKLIVGHKRIALTMTQWTEGFILGLFFMTDFDDEPEFVQKLARKAFESGKSKKWLDFRKKSWGKMTPEEFASNPYQPWIHDMLIADFLGKD